jgi:UDP-N-acetylglucosamine/UDP-N-acetylgalactosamine diphosphorylase
MIKVSGRRDQINVAKVYSAGQEHIFAFWEELTEKERRELLSQIDMVDFQLVSALAKQFARQEKPQLVKPLRPEDIVQLLKMQEEARRAPVLPPYAGQKSPPQADRVAPVSVAKRDLVKQKPRLIKPLRPEDIVRLSRTEEDLRKASNASVVGEAVLRANKVAILTVAGGQATRLNSVEPKGFTPVGPVSGKSLFALFAETIVALRRKYDASLPWYIVTSDATDARTKEFFAENSYFGMAKAQVTFLKQGTLPAVDRRGKVILETKNRIYLSPSGHGGALGALGESGTLKDLDSKGFSHLFYFQVDNPLVRIVDPVFIGYHVLAGAEIASKAVWKREPAEKMGVFCLADDKVSVVEYSELSEEDSRRTDQTGSLLFGAGSIAVHVFSIPFLLRLWREGVRLPYHVTYKAVPHITKSGTLMKPEKPNAYKFEMFVFDMFKYSSRTLVLEVKREDEFSPVKNASGKDSPETASRDLSNMYARMLASCGVSIPFGAGEQVDGKVEISPLYSLDEDELRRRISSASEMPHLAPGGELYLHD